MGKFYIFFSLILLSGCSLTQPKAPVFNGIKYHPVQKRTAVKKSAPKFVEKQRVKKQKIYHTVEKGEYIYSIARKYKISPNQLIKKNKLKKPYRLYQGDKLYIKTVSKTVKYKQRVASIKKSEGYSLTRNPSLYDRIKQMPKKILRSLPVQDPNRPSQNENIDFGYHKVKRGENLFRIGKKYGVSVFDLMAYNDLSRPEELKAGSELKIPVAKEEISKPKIKPSGKTVNLKDLEIELIDKKTASKKGFVYPLKGRIISKFGVHGHGIRNDGIDIATKIGTPVRAAKQGRIMYSQDISSLGKMVLIKHSNGYISAYTHNSKLLVKKGQKVAKGQVIALSGDSGNAKQPMLHFEIRRYGKSINPTPLLH